MRAIVLNVFVCFLRAVNSASVTSIQIVDNEAAVKGRTIQIQCATSNFDSTGTVNIHMTDTRNTVLEPINRLNSCFWNSCRFQIDGYNFSVNTQGVTVSISKLSRNEHQKWWHCAGDDGSTTDLYITVYTIPTSLECAPVDNQDLSYASVTISCETNCIYPRSSIAWFYTHESTVHEYNANGSVTSDTTTCTDQEKTFSSTLVIPKYTTFDNNADKTVTFKCGISSCPGLHTALYSNESSNIRFAVRVTGVTLRDDEDIPDDLSLTVTSRQSKRLSCVPSLSRPPPTIIWYIGNTERQRSTNSSFSFKPVNSDHDETIYCKVFNIPPETSAVSSTIHNLYVKVASITLKDGNNIANSTVIATEGVSRTLTCEPGLSRPDPYISWYIGGHLKQNSTRKEYTFIPTDALHNKVVYCTAANSNLKAVESVKPKIYVRVSPKVISSDGFFGDVGQPIVITIPFYSRPIYTHLKLTRGSSELVDDARYTVSTNPANVTEPLDKEDVVLDGYQVVISIVNLTEVDITNFYLEIENVVDVNFWQFAIEERVKPSSPFALQAIEPTSVPLFYFEKQSNGGYQQTFIIETAPVKTDVWTETLVIQEGDKRYKLPCGSYIAGIEGLAHGEYSVRLLAENKLGMSDAVLLSSTFTITGTPNSQTESVSVAAVAGGTVASVVIVIAVLTGVVIFFRKRQGTTGKTEGRQERETGIRMKTQESNTVPQYSNEDVPTQSVGQMDEARNVYEKIDPDMRHGDPYEALELEAVSADYEKTDDKSYENV